MKNIYFSSLTNSFFFILIFFISCNGQEKAERSKLIQQKEAINLLPNLESNPQIAEYIRNIIQDKNGDLWFGTNGYGIVRYDGEGISYFSNKEGFNGSQITGITEDIDKNLWFSTDQGVVKCEIPPNSGGKVSFLNFTDFIYFRKQNFWSILADSKGVIWAGTATTIYRYNGIIWEVFKLPFSKNEEDDFITKATSWSILEDRAGNVWISTNGYGAFKYNGESFTQYSEKDGLTNNNVDVILEDKKGNIWFGTRYGGVSRFDGTSFINYTSNDSIGNNEVCVIYEDKRGDIWFSSEGYGVYRYNFKSDKLTNYGEKEGLKVRAVQTIFEDNESRFWVGGGGGLYRFDGERFFNVTKTGPWD